MMGSNIRRNFLFLGLISTTFFLSACSKKSDSQQAQGDVRVQVSVQSSEASYALQVVHLIGISNLNEVGGSFARFFYSPGATETQITGSAPHANFIRANDFFVPMDTISMQMATIYYHLQNLALFDKSIGAQGVNKWPRSVGLETQILDPNSGTQKNNAFYNGQTDSMMFVPFDLKNLPITVNAGIIAHEHFHSLFYKIVILPAAASQKLSNPSASVHGDENAEVQVRGRKMSATSSAVTENEKVQIFNETFLRGINEGLADFWGWVYTNDPEFMRWSLPDFQARRTLKLSESDEGSYETKEKITSKVNEMLQFADNPQAALINYAYEIGTPYARFLKQFSQLQSDSKGISLTDSKNLTAQLVFNYLKELAAQVQSLKEGDAIEPLSLFNYVAKLADENSLVRLDQKSCDFVLKYVNLNQVDSTKRSSCKENPNLKGQKDSSFVIIKP